MDPESNSANTTTDPRAHVTSESVEELPAGLFMDEGGEDAPTSEDTGERGPVGLDTEEKAGEAEAAEPAAGEEEGAAEEAHGDDAGEELNDAPEFWSAEDKAAWATVPPALRPILQKYEKARVAFEQEKAREAAQVRKEAAEQGKQAQDHIEAGAKFWQANGPQFFKAFGDKWASVDWDTLARENPAEYTALRQQRESEGNLLRQAHEQGVRDIESTNKRAHVQHLEARRTEHDKIATKMPEFFGNQERAAKTYKELGDFLASKGIPAERINATYEAPLIEMALNAMRFEKAQKQASTVVNRDEATGKFTARTAPTKRVQPGPALNRDTGDQNADAARRAGERFKTGKGADMEAAAEFARRTNLFS